MMFSLISLWSIIFSHRSIQSVYILQSNFQTKSDTNVVLYDSQIQYNSNSLVRKLLEQIYRKKNIKILETDYKSTVSKNLLFHFITIYFTFVSFFELSL